MRATGLSYPPREAWRPEEIAVEEAVPESAATDPTVTAFVEGGPGLSRETPRESGKPVVLVVEDSSSIRHQTVKFIENAGLRAITAVDGAEALELLLNGVEPDLVLSDVEMPNMNGWELLEYVKTDDNFGHVPVVMVTSLDSDNYRSLAKKLGASDYVVKPFGAKELERILEEFCTVTA